MKLLSLLSRNLWSSGESRKLSRRFQYSVIVAKVYNVIRAKALVSRVFWKYMEVKCK